MTTDSCIISQCIHTAVQELNSANPDQDPIPLEPETILFGIGGQLDSIRLVHLLATLEELVEDKLSIKIALADENAFSSVESPFGTLATLENYLGKRIEEAQNR